MGYSEFQDVGVVGVMKLVDGVTVGVMGRRDDTVIPRASG